MIDTCYVGDVRDGLRRATVAESAYCAGVLDSDGTIGVKRSTYSMRVVKDSGQPTYSERVCVRQVEPAAVDLLHRLFGGGFRAAKAYAERGKPLFEWTVTDRNAAACLRALLPYLRIKKAQAENCLNLRAVKEASKTASDPGHVHINWCDDEFREFIAKWSPAMLNYLPPDSSP